jgi:hypothetical protein
MVGRHSHSAGTKVVGLQSNPRTEHVSCLGSRNQSRDRHLTTVSILGRRARACRIARTMREVAEAAALANALVLEVVAHAGSWPLAPARSAATALLLTRWSEVLLKRNEVARRLLELCDPNQTRRPSVCLRLRPRACRGDFSAGPTSASCSDRQGRSARSPPA